MTRAKMPRRRLRRAIGAIAGLALVALAAQARVARAFPYTVGPGDTAASLSERFYGRIELEAIVVAANRLDERVPLSPGMRIEIPAVEFHRVAPGETWKGLAEEFLADPARAEALALANESEPWDPPKAGREVVVPYPLQYVAREGDTVQSLAYRFLGQRDAGMTIDRFNRRSGSPLAAGDVVLLPIASLRLTDEGREMARRGAARTQSEDGGDARDAQTEAAQELPALEGELRRGEWLAALVRGNRLAAGSALADEQAARVHRALLEAYVALGEGGLAARACEEWRRVEPEARLDPIDHSPKLMRACPGAAARDAGTGAATRPTGSAAR
jgi:phage tail protein X